MYLGGYDTIKFPNIEPKVCGANLVSTGGCEKGCKNNIPRVRNDSSSLNIRFYYVIIKI